VKNLICQAGVAIILACASWAATAAPRKVTLAIPSMDCPVCPITIKKALSKVTGVSRADVNFELRQAVVEFDDVKTNVGVLMESTRNAGYPSTVLGTAN
jgi:periplasmic mercuric ion binding protein